MKNILLCCLAFFFVPVPSYASDCPEVSDVKEVFWSGYYQVSGQSAPGQPEYLAKIAARIMAQNRILEILKGLEIRQKTVITDGQVESSVIEAKLEGLVKNVVIHQETYDPGTKTATACVRLYLSDGSDGIERAVYESIKRSVDTGEVAQ
ncbi:hypothetical protein [Desulfoplanes sp.]